ncbi:MAG: sigma-70 family RNA polymerase sigma factor [Syntrophomonadaceae bacterium]|nr:sigma-70 family RNA polymerase sigma factor [Syntrophomonadaceae bacterium]
MPIIEPVKDERLKTLEEYFRDEYKEMLSVASYMLNNQALAEVAVQDTFVVALENIDKLTASPSPVGWLYVVLKNNVRHMWRDQRTMLKHFVSLEDTPEIEAMDTGHEVNSLINEDNNHEMELLIQFYIQGYSIKELARKYGISIGACKMRIKRAKDRLKNNYSSS